MCVPATSHPEPGSHCPGRTALRLLLSDTGPCYEKYNVVLRSLSGNNFLQSRCDELTHGNRYATTIHAISSCVLKLSNLTVITKVYRGLQGVALPDLFFEPDGHGACGGVEYGFSSTVRRRRTPR